MHGKCEWCPNRGVEDGPPVGPDDVAQCQVGVDCATAADRRSVHKRVRSVSSRLPGDVFGTSLSVERWLECGVWHARTVFGDVVGPEVTSDSGEAAWFRAAAEYFEQIDRMPRA